MTITDDIRGLWRAFEGKVRKEQAEGKPVPTYIIELDSRELIKIRGTHDLIKKLTPSDKGKRVRIIYEGTEQVTNGKMMKFRVLTKPGRDPRNNPEITDDDLPEFMR